MVVIAQRLFARGRTMGALNLMSSRPAAFGDDALSTAALFAALASIRSCRMADVQCPVRGMSERMMPLRGIDVRAL